MAFLNHSETCFSQSKFHFLLPFIKICQNHCYRFVLLFCHETVYPYFCLVGWLGDSLQDLAMALISAILHMCHQMGRLLSIIPGKIYINFRSQFNSYFFKYVKQLLISTLSSQIVPKLSTNL